MSVTNSLPSSRAVAAAANDPKGVQLSPSRTEVSPEAPSIPSSPSRSTSAAEISPGSARNRPSTSATISCDRRRRSRSDSTAVSQRAVATIVVVATTAINTSGTVVDNPPIPRARPNPSKSTEPRAPGPMSPAISRPRARRVRSSGSSSNRRGSSESSRAAAMTGITTHIRPRALNPTARTRPRSSSKNRIAAANSPPPITPPAKAPSHKNTNPTRAIADDFARRFRRNLSFSRTKTQANPDLPRP